MRTYQVYRCNVSPELFNRHPKKECFILYYAQADFVGSPSLWIFDMFHSHHQADRVHVDMGAVPCRALSLDLNWSKACRSVADVAVLMWIPSLWSLWWKAKFWKAKKQLQPVEIDPNFLSRKRLATAFAPRGNPPVPYWGSSQVLKEVVHIFHQNWGDFVILSELICKTL